MNNNILITGSSGFLGGAILNKLQSTENYHIVSAVRHYQEIRTNRVRIEFIGEIGPITNWTKAVKDIDVIIHCAARNNKPYLNKENALLEYRLVNVDGSIALARQALRAGVKRFIYISSTKVYGGVTSSDQIISADDVAEPNDPYGISKLEAEKKLIDLCSIGHMELVIVRLPLVYGPRVKGNFYSLVQLIRNKIPLPLGNINNRRSFIALENVVNFIELCVNYEQSKNAANELFILSDGEDVSITDLLYRIGRAYKIDPVLLPVPEQWLKLMLKLLNMREMTDSLLGSFIVDNSKAYKVLGWSPIVSMDEQLFRMSEYDATI